MTPLSSKGDLDPESKFFTTEDVKNDHAADRRHP
jgi:hypothetical protein